MLYAPLQGIRASTMAKTTCFSVHGTCVARVNVLRMLYDPNLILPTLIITIFVSHSRSRSRSRRSWWCYSSSSTTTTTTPTAGPSLFVPRRRKIMQVMLNLWQNTHTNRGGKRQGDTIPCIYRHIKQKSSEPSQQNPKPKSTTVAWKSRLLHSEGMGICSVSENPQKQICRSLAVSGGDKFLQWA